MADVILEAVCATLDEVSAAVEAGADRIELCAGLEVGGVTPTPGMVAGAVDSGLPVVAMLRSAESWWVPSAGERRAMLRDAEWIGRSGAVAVVAGALTDSGDFDFGFLREVGAASGLPVVCHRFLDFSSDPWGALSRLVEEGLAVRVLTAGGRGSAWEGREWIARAVSVFGGRVEVLPGGGVGPGNVADLVRVTGVGQVHFSIRRSVGEGYGGVGLSEPDGEKVRAVRLALGG